ncbi:MAG: DUF4167 domain-containing protein [Proteobacteria bacterium]|nr:DUF4167 domain-containing protein [Pseudomonadota bacterium]
MRPGFHSKRPRGNRSNVRRGPGQHRSHSIDSNGPQVKVRGNANQICEKYLSLARDAATAGDRIMAENYFQHAEHYYRVVNGDGQRTPQHQQRQPQVAEKPQPAENPQPADAAPTEPATEPQS